MAKKKTQVPVSSASEPTDILTIQECMERSPFDPDAAGAVGLFERAIRLRADAKKMEARAKELKNQADLMAGDAFDVLNVKGIKEPGVGSLYRTNGKSVTYSAARLKEAMLKAQIPVDVIAAVVEEAKKETTYATITFKPDKGV